MKIEFEDSTRRLDGERRSKLLKKGSDLYNQLQLQHNYLQEKYGILMAPKRMDFHFELVGRNEEPTDELLVSRVRELEGCEVDTNNVGTFYRAWVLYGPEVSGYGPTHCTIGFFRAGLPNALVSVE